MKILNIDGEFNENNISLVIQDSDNQFKATPPDQSINELIVNGISCPLCDELVEVRGIMLPSSCKCSSLIISPSLWSSCVVVINRIFANTIDLQKWIEDIKCIRSAEIGIIFDYLAERHNEEYARGFVQKYMSDPKLNLILNYWKTQGENYLAEFLKKRTVSC